MSLRVQSNIISADYAYWQRKLLHRADVLGGVAAGLNRLDMPMLRLEQGAQRQIRHQINQQIRHG